MYEVLKDLIKILFKGRIFQTYVLKVRVQKEQSLCSKAEGKGQQTVLCGPEPMEGAMLASIPEAQESPSGRKLPSGSPAVTKYKILEEKKKSRYGEIKVSTVKLQKVRINVSQLPLLAL